MDFIKYELFRIKRFVEKNNSSCIQWKLCSLITGDQHYIVLLHSGQVIVPHWVKNAVKIRNRKQKTSNFMFLCGAPRLHQWTWCECQTGAGCTEAAHRHLLHVVVFHAMPWNFLTLGEDTVKSAPLWICPQILLSKAALHATLKSLCVSSKWGLEQIHAEVKILLREKSFLEKKKRGGKQTNKQTKSS